MSDDKDILITKVAVAEYEQLRRSGVTNMFDIVRVRYFAKRVKFKALEELASEQEKYKYFLMHFSTYMKKYEINQSV